MQRLDPARRGFLRGLASLPLVGGGLTLIGRPTAAAVPVTDALLARYHAFVAWEHRETYVEIQRRTAERLLSQWVADPRPDQYPVSPNFPALYAAEARRHPPMYHFPEEPTVVPVVTGAPPSSRAAVVLAAIGCGWQA